MSYIIYTYGNYARIRVPVCSFSRCQLRSTSHAQGRTRQLRRGMRSASQNGAVALYDDASAPSERSRGQALVSAASHQCRGGGASGHGGLAGRGRWVRAAGTRATCASSSQHGWGSAPSTSVTRCLPFCLFPSFFCAFHESRKPFIWLFCI